MENRKVNGPDRTNAELFKYGREDLNRPLHVVS
jgi:hypothetical protein